ncbi:MAG TPA: hypothetical protein DIU06_05625 [Rhodospirillaceae bacterium]|nr:hypothetical protein [Rhodospirillaceae bacterium]|tara:strand:+ start:8888 stop:9310 length:423 start_codon:yes stop_codon:yes gene_type:complete
MRIISIAFTVFLVCAVFSATALAQTQRYDLNNDMHHLYLNNNSRTGSAPSQTQSTDNAPKDYDAQRQEIWQKYKAIAAGKETAPQPKAPDTVAPSAAAANTQKSGYGAGNILNSYQQAQEQRQKMQSLQFPAPKLEKMDE